MMRFQDILLMLGCFSSLLAIGHSRALSDVVLDETDDFEGHLHELGASGADWRQSESTVDFNVAKSGALFRILANEPLEAAKALELLRYVAESDSGQKQLDAKALIELSNVSFNKCPAVPDVLRDHAHLDKSLGPYLRLVHRRQEDLCSMKTYGAELMKAASRLDEQVRADVDLLASGLDLPQNYDPQDGLPENNLMQAIVKFVVAETKKPESERRYAQPSVFADMKAILLEDCNKVNELLGRLIGTTLRVDIYRLNVDELALFTKGKLCAQLVKKNSASFKLASIVFKNM